MNKKMTLEEAMTLDRDPRFNKHGEWKLYADERTDALYFYKDGINVFCSPGIIMREGFGEEADDLKVYIEESDSEGRMIGCPEISFDGSAEDWFRVVTMYLDGQIQKR